MSFADSSSAAANTDTAFAAKTKVAYQQVTSIGNSWIKCKSKSQNGRIYYFNTLTGEATWDFPCLSDGERKKVKNKVKVSNQQMMEGFPEPKEPPRDLQESGIQAQSLNTNALQNPCLEQPFAIVPLNITNPVNPFMPFTVNGPNGSNIWAMPVQSQQIYFTPIPPVCNRSQALVNLSSDPERQEHNMRVDKSPTQFEAQNVKQMNFGSNKPLRQWSSSTLESDQNFKNLHTFDLRELLVAKRVQRKQSYRQQNDQAGKDSLSTIERDTIDKNKKLAKKDLLTETKIQVNDCVEQEKNTSVDCLQKTLTHGNETIKYNVTHLKNLAKPHMQLDTWYIVIDKDIILNHYNFINNVCNSDGDCCLMVPQQVVTGLKAATNGPSHVARRARRALSFISQQLETGGFIVIDDSTDKEGDNDYLLSCCSKLMDQNKHAILISNNEELKFLKVDSHIPIFNIKDLKNFLTSATPSLEQVNVKPDRLKPPPCMSKKLNKIIKLPVNNKASNLLNKESPLQAKEQTEEKCSDVQLKKTAEIGVQTDTTFDIDLKIVENSVSTSGILSNTLSKTFSEDEHTMFSPQLLSQAIENNNLEDTSNREQLMQNSSREFDEAIAANSAQNNNKTSSTNLKTNEKSQELRLNTDITLLNMELCEEQIKDTGAEDQNMNFSTNKPQDLTKMTFEVRDQVMENSLKVMSDEWNSRFNQIMEEMMTQILYRDEFFLNEVVYKYFGGGPWSVQEALECIKNKFSDNMDVVRAAGELKNSLTKLSDSFTGGIKLSLQPTEYMEMYSNGVNLVETLKIPLGKCEDIFVASQSLSQLLDDIHKPHFKNLSESFVTKSPKLIIQGHEKNTKSFEDKIIALDLAPECITKTKKACETESENPALLNPLICKDNPIPHVESDKSIADELQLNNSVNYDNCQEFIDEPKRCAEPDNSQPLLGIMDPCIQSVHKSTTDEKKIGHKQKKDSQYNLRAKKNITDRVPLDMDLLIYSDCNSEDNSDHNNNESTNTMKASLGPIENESELSPNRHISVHCPLINVLSKDKYIGNRDAENFLMIKLNPSDFARGEFLVNNDSENYAEDSSLNVNTDLNIIFGLVINNIKRTLFDVKSFWFATSKELAKPNYTSQRKCELQEENLKTQDLISCLIESIKGICCREVDPENNIEALLQNAGIFDFSLDSTQLDRYRNAIEICLEKANILQEAVAALGVAIRNKPTN